MEEKIMFRLRKAMEENGLSATELSKLSGVGKSDISYYLKGKYEPKQDKCYLLAKALDVDPGWLMTGVQPAEQNESETNLVVPKTVEAQIISSKVDRLTEEQRKMRFLRTSEREDANARLSTCCNQSL